jgi:hypothetical protein
MLCRKLQGSHSGRRPVLEIDGTVAHDPGLPNSCKWLETIVHSRPMQRQCNLQGRKDTFQAPWLASLARINLITLAEQMTCGVGCSHTTFGFRSRGSSVSSWLAKAAPELLSITPQHPRSHVRRPLQARGTPVDRNHVNHIAYSKRVSITISTKY